MKGAKKISQFNPIYTSFLDKKRKMNVYNVHCTLQTGSLIQHFTISVSDLQFGLVHFCFHLFPQVIGLDNMTNHSHPAPCSLQ